MKKYHAWFERYASVIVLLLQGLRYTCIGGTLVCLGAAVLVCWQYGFIGKWRMGVFICLAFAAYFYWLMHKVTWLAGMMRRLAQASA